MLVDHKVIPTLVRYMSRAPTTLVAETVVALLRICTELPPARDLLQAALDSRECAAQRMRDRAALGSGECAAQRMRDLAANGNDKAQQLLQLLRKQPDAMGQ